MRHVVSAISFLICLATLQGAETTVPAMGPPPPPAPGTAHAAAASIASALSPVTSLFNIGYARIRPRMLYRFLEADNVQSRPGQPESTTIHSITVGTTVDIGAHWQVDYAPTWTFYSSDAFQDPVDHTFHLSGNVPYQDWSLRFNLSYLDSSQLLVETADQTDEKFYSAGASAGYRLGSRTSIDNGINWSLRDTDLYPELRTWGTNHAFRYQIATGIDVGPALRFEVTDQDANHTVSWRPSLQLAWRPGSRLVVDLNGGVKFQQVRRPVAREYTDFVASAKVTYTPLQFTSLDLNFEQDVTPSYFDALTQKRSGWNAGIYQRVLTHLAIDARWGWTRSEYVANGTGVELRNDSYRTFSVRLQTTLRKRIALALSYQNTTNATNAAGFGFGSKQYGAEVGISY